MAAILKHWRESASLILVSRRLDNISKQQNNNSLFRKILPQKKANLPTDDTDKEMLRMLLLRRSSGSSFMPSVHVFPGGVLDDTDFSKEWLDLLSFNGDHEHHLNLFTHGNPGSRIFSRTRDVQFSIVPSEIVLRIAAIRETFEESGILLARTKSECEKINPVDPSSHPLTAAVYKMSGTEIRHWRKKVVSHPLEFLNLCRELEVVPDIWSLYEWANWLTPTSGKLRFNTAFFLSCVDEAPQIMEDKGETDHGMWANPSSVLQASLRGLVHLAPPQVYEMSRLARFSSVDDLLTLAWKRSRHRVKEWMPVILSCKDGLVFLLPGDELYPEDPDFTGEKGTKLKRTESFAELSRLHPRQHRAFLRDEDKNLSLVCNLDYLDGHILPHSIEKKKEFDNRW